MRCNHVMVLCFSLVILATPSQARAQLKAAPGDWPGWRGADRTGVSTETGLLKEWPADGPITLLPRPGWDYERIKHDLAGSVPIHDLWPDLARDLAQAGWISPPTL